VISVNQGFGIRSRPTTPLISVKRLAELGVARVSLPRLLPSAALMAMQNALALMKKSIETGELYDRPDMMMGIEDVTALMGYARINQLEQDFSLEEDLEKRFGGNVDLVVRGAH
jgi:2-methylisocitrate lyase-like PEP mutase family enzyme